MVALQIRDVPDEVNTKLADMARARGQSVQAFLLAVVTREANRSDNLRILQQFAGRSDGVVTVGDDIVAAVAAERIQRDQGSSLRAPRA